MHTQIGDGYQGWPEAAPFDKIIVTCSPEKVPTPLVEQLREGGRMIIPVGERYQQTLYLFEKQNGELKSIALLPTLFVPMTGKAEDDRVVKPDPEHPELRNGGFEQQATGRPTGWHYQRQLALIEDAKAPEGKHYVTFRNEEAGRGAQALQGLAIDGRKVHEIDLSAWVRGVNIRPGLQPSEHPMVMILFYDSDRRQLAANFLGPWQGTFAWQHVAERIKVPPKALEANVFVGLCGATGELSVDDVRLSAAVEKVIPRFSRRIGTARWSLHSRAQADVQQQTDGQRIGQQARTAIADQRQCQPRDWQQAEHHPRVDQHLHRQQRGDADGHQPAIGFARFLGDDQPAPDQRHEQGQQQGQPAQAQPLDQHADDRIGVRLGNEVGAAVVGGVAGPQAAAPAPQRSQLLGLVEMVGVVARLPTGMGLLGQGRDTGTLLAAHLRPEYRHQRGADDHHQRANVAAALQRQTASS